MSSVPPPPLRPPDAGAVTLGVLVALLAGALLYGGARLLEALRGALGG